MKMKMKMQFMTVTALLAALVVLLGVTPVGFINVGVIYITFLCVPVIVGALAMGMKCGLILGACMGFVSFYTALHAPSALVAPILQNGLIYVIIMCFVPRLLVPLVTCCVKNLLKKVNCKGRLFAAAAAGSLTNTVLYLGLMILFYRLIGIENSALLTTVGTIVLTAGLPEAAAAALISTPIILALRKARLIHE